MEMPKEFDAIVFDPNQAVRSCFKDPEITFKAGLGGTFSALALVLFVANPLFLPISLCLCALISGYVLNVIRDAVTGQGVDNNDAASKLPNWSSPFDLLISGLTWMAVAMVHLFLVFGAAAIIFCVGVFRGSIYALSHEYAIWVTASLIVLSIIYMVVSFYSSYLMTNFACEERTGAAFNLVAVHRHIAKNPLAFIQAWLIGMGLQWIAFLIPLCSVIGVFFLPLSLFLAQVISGLLFAQVWVATNKK